MIPSCTSRFLFLGQYFISMSALLLHPQLGEVLLQFLAAVDFLKMRSVNSELDPIVEEVTKERNLAEFRRFFLEPRNDEKAKAQYALAAHLAQLQMSEEQWLNFIGDCQGLPRPPSGIHDRREPHVNFRRWQVIFLSLEDPRPKPLPSSLYYTYQVGDVQWLSQQKGKASTTPPIVDAERPGCLHLGIPPRKSNHTLTFRLTSSITSVCIVGGEGIVRIDSRVLNHYPVLKRLTLNGFHNVATVGRDFIASCAHLESVSLSGFTSVTTIADKFLDDCPELKSVKLAPSCFSSLTTIEGSFLSGSRSLTCPLPHLPSLRSIGDFGLTGNACAIVDLGLCFPSLARVGKCFLKNAMVSALYISCDLKEFGPDFCADCKRLDVVDCKGLSSVEIVSAGFFRRSRFDTIDLSPMVNAKLIDDYFLSGTQSARKASISVQGLDGLCSVEKIGGEFLSGSSISSDGECIDLTGFSSLLEVGHGFLKGCRGLQRVKFSGLHGLRSIGRDFLAKNKPLKQIDLSGLPNVEAVGRGLFANCPALAEVTTLGSSRCLRAAVAQRLGPDIELLRDE